MESVVITDTTGGRVCLECSFYSFSTDTGCTVELVSSDSGSSVQYTETINRSANGTAKGCVSGINEGEYIVRVYDQTSFMLLHEVNHVTVKSLTITTSTGKMSPSPIISTLVNTPDESESEYVIIITNVLVVLHVLNISVCSVGYPVYSTSTVSFDSHSTEQFGRLIICIHVHVYLHTRTVFRTFINYYY